MSTAQSEAALPAELEAIASAAHDRLHAQAEQDLSAQEAAQRHVAEAASADGEYEQAIARAGRLGLSHREIAAAAEVSHGTVRAILTCATASPNGNEPQAAEEESTASDDIAQ